MQDRKGGTLGRGRFLAFAGTGLALWACAAPSHTTPKPLAPTKAPVVGVLGAPASPAASRLAAASPGGLVTPTPGGTPLAPLASPVLSLRDRLQDKLLAIARVNFANTRGQLISDNGGGLISDTGGSIISNNGGGLLSNNGASLISDNGGSLSAGHPLHLLALDRDPQATPGPDELLVADLHWADGTGERFIHAKPPGTQSRVLELNATGKVVHMHADQNVVLDAQGKLLADDVRNLRFNEDGVFYKGVDAHYSYKGTETLDKVSFKDGEFDEPVSGVHIVIDRFDYDSATGVAQFGTRYVNFQLVETGELDHVPLDATGDVSLTVTDPLGANDGHSQTASSDGTALFGRVQTHANGVLKLSYDLLEGTQLVFTGAAADGQVLEQGQPAGTVHRSTDPDGARRLQVTLADDPTHPIAVTAGQATSVSPPPNIGAGTRLGTFGTLAGSTPGFLDETAPLTKPPGQFDNPTGLAVTTGGAIVVADAKNNRIRTLGFADATSSQIKVSTLVGTGATGDLDGTADVATLNDPRMVTVAPTGAVFFAEGAGNRIRSLTIDNGIFGVLTVAGDGSAGYLDGPALAAQFNSPRGIVSDASGRLYVADRGNQRIRCIGLDGQVTTLAGNGTAGFLDGPGLSASFNQPFALVLDLHGDLLVSDSLNRRIRKISLADPTHPVTTFAGGGSAGIADGSALGCGLGQPYGLAMGPRGDLYIADNAAGSIRRVAPDGTVTTMGGLPATTPKDGPGNTAGIASIFGLGVDLPAAGLIFTDATFSRVRVLAFAPDGPGP